MLLHILRPRLGKLLVAHRVDVSVAVPSKSVLGPVLVVLFPIVYASLDVLRLTSVRYLAVVYYIIQRLQNPPDPVGSRPRQSVRRLTTFADVAGSDEVCLCLL